MLNQLASATPAPRILHLVYRPRRSGAEMLVSELCLQHAKQGVECGVAALHPAEADFQEALSTLTSAGVRCFIPSKGRGRIGRIDFLRKIISSFQPTVVFGHSVWPSFYGRLACLTNFSRRPSAYTVLHSATNDDYSDPLLNVLERFHPRPPDAVIGVSLEGLEAYHRRFQAARPLHLIVNGINTEHLRACSARRNSLRSAYGLSTSAKLILQVGRISPVKQQHASLVAVAPLLRHDPSLQFWMAGLTEDMAYRDYLRDLVMQLGVQDQAKLLGSRDDIAELLACSDLYLMPSTHEAHSVGMLEALASGVTIVCSQIPSFDYARGQPGVTAVDPSDVMGFTEACSGALAGALRFERELDRYDISRTANAYLTLGAAEDRPANV